MIEVATTDHPLLTGALVRRLRILDNAGLPKTHVRMRCLRPTDAYARRTSQGGPLRSERNRAVPRPTPVTCGMPTLAYRKDTIELHPAAKLIVGNLCRFDEHSFEAGKAPVPVLCGVEHIGNRHRCNLNAHLAKNSKRTVHVKIACE